jgi:hypothetical protein
MPRLPGQELHRLPGLPLDVGDAVVQRERVRGDPAQSDVQHGISQ